jgi:protein gp37
MALTPQHTYMILTKRPERMAEYTTQKFGRIADRIIAMRRERGDNGVLIPLPNIRPGAPWWPLANVWLGTSVEDQATVDARIPHLLRCPAAVRFLSCEPLLGAVDLWPVMEVHKEYRRIHENACFRDPSTPPRNIHWVITGGESGHGARPMHPDWARSLRDQCKAAEVPFFFKQWGEWAPHTHVGGVLQSKGNVDLVMSAMTRCGKKTAGNLLDGMTHQEWPVVAQYEVA